MCLHQSGFHTGHQDVAGTTVYDDKRLQSLKLLEDTRNATARIEESLAHIEERLGELEVRYSFLEISQLLT